MARRWLKNGETVTKNIQAQYLFWFLTTCCEFILIDYNNPLDWVSVTGATDGLLDASLPSTFKTPLTNPYLFTVADIGRRIAIRDTVNPKNSGVYKITGIVNPHQVNLNAPVANFVGTSTACPWTLFDITSAPPNGAWFVIQSPASVGWQARVIINAAPPAGVAIELGAFGGWNGATDTWGLPVSSQVLLNNTCFTTFAIADETLGTCFMWSEDGPFPGPPGRTAIYLGQFAGLHAPSGIGVPRDDAPVCLLGDNTATANTMNRLYTGPTSGFAINGQISLPDKSGYAPAFIQQWRRVSDDVDFFSVAASNIDPRSGQSDSFQFLVYQTTPVVAFRGLLPLVRLCSNFIPTKTTINSGHTYVVQGGIAIEWDTSTPV